MSKKRKPEATVMIEFYRDGVEVDITGANKLTAGRLQRSFRFTYQALHREHTKIRRRRKEKIRQEEEAALLEAAEV